MGSRRKDENGNYYPSSIEAAQRCRRRKPSQTPSDESDLSLDEIAQKNGGYMYLIRGFSHWNTSSMQEEDVFPSDDFGGGFLYLSQKNRS